MKISFFVCIITQRYNLGYHVVIDRNGALVPVNLAFLQYSSILCNNIKCFPHVTS